MSGRQGRGGPGVFSSQPWGRAEWLWGSRGWGVKGGLGCFPHSSSSLLVFASQISTFLAVLGPDHSVREVAGLLPRALPALCFLDLSRSVRFSKALPFPGQPSYSGCRRF